VSDVSFTLASVQELLLAWFRASGRDLPWRETRDPYAILVSEVMAQQYGLESVDQSLCGTFPLYHSRSAS
jgi:A/G-specific adenine glycosylase